MGFNLLRITTLVRFGTDGNYPSKDSFRRLYAPKCRKLVSRVYQIARQQKIELPREIKPGLEYDVTDALFEKWRSKFEAALKPEQRFDIAFEPDREISDAVTKFFTDFAGAYESDPNKLKLFRTAVTNYVRKEWWANSVVNKIQSDVSSPGPEAKTFTKTWGPDVEAILMSRFSQKHMADRRKSSYDELSSRITEQLRDNVELKKLYQEYLSEDIAWMKTLDPEQIQDVGPWKFQNETVNWSKDRVEMRVKDEIERLYPDLNDSEAWNLIYDYIYWDEVWPDLKDMIKDQNQLRRQLFDE